MAGKKTQQVNIGTKERPIFIPGDQVVGENTSFWQGVANGNVLIGGLNGIDLDRALRIGKGGKGRV